jgi:hypothetical protein
VKIAKMAALALSIALAGCVKQPASLDYSAFRTHDPHSILVVPVLNNTASLTAQDYFLSTISVPFAERGYYVFPAHMVKSLLEKEGLSDAGLVHQASPTRMGQIFNCDAVLYIEINKWESRYVVLSTTTDVAFHYRLASCRDGTTLWENKREMTYTPQTSSGGNPLAALLVQAIVAAIEKSDPNYMPLAAMANLQAASLPGQGLPAGPYLPAQYQKDQVNFGPK